MPSLTISSAVGRAAAFAVALVFVALIAWCSKSSPKFEEQPKVSAHDEGRSLHGHAGPCRTDRTPDRLLDRGCCRRSGQRSGSGDRCLGRCRWGNTQRLAASVRRHDLVRARPRHLAERVRLDSTRSYRRYMATDKPRIRPRCPALASPVRWLDAKLRLVDELEADVTALARRRESTRGSACARKRACRCRFSGRAEPRLQPRLLATFGSKGAPGATTPSVRASANRASADGPAAVPPLRRSGRRTRARSRRAHVAARRSGCRRAASSSSRRP